MKILLFYLKVSRNPFLGKSRTLQYVPAYNKPLFKLRPQSVSYFKIPFYNQGKSFLNIGYTFFK